MPYDINDLVALVIAERGDALHLHFGEPPILEIGEKLHRIEGPSMSEAETENILRFLAGPEIWSEFNRSGSACFQYSFDSLNMERFRVMAFQEGDRLRLELRRLVS